MKKIFYFAHFLFLFFPPFLITAQTNPTSIKDLIGVNIRAQDGFPQGFNKFGLVREYHEWASDVSYDDNAQTDCDFLTDYPLQLNPSTNPVSIINFDGFYDAFNGRMSPCLKGVAPQMRGLKTYCGEVLEQKPVCLGNGQPGYGNQCANQFASQLAVSHLSKEGDGGLEKNDFPPAVDGYFNGVGLGAVKANTSYEGSVKIKRSISNEIYFIKIWLDDKKIGGNNTWASEPDGYFYNQAYARDLLSGQLLFNGNSLMPNNKYEAVHIEGENNLIEHLLILKENDFDSNGEKEVHFSFQTNELPQNGLYRIRISVNSLHLSIPRYIEQNPSFSPHLELSDLDAPTPSLSVSDGAPGYLYEWKSVVWNGGSQVITNLGTNSSITALERNKTYQVKITNLDGDEVTIEFYYNPDVIPYNLNKEAILYPQPLFPANEVNYDNSLHTYCWSKDGILGLGYWWPVNSTSATGDIWDVGLLKCGDNAVYPTPESLWGANDLNTQLIQCELYEIGVSGSVIDIQQNFLSGERNGYNNFADFSQGVVSGNIYKIKIEGPQNLVYKMWLMKNNGTVVQLVTGNTGSEQEITFPNVSSGLYRLRIGIGGNPLPHGNFNGELRDFLLVVNNGDNIACQVPDISSPNSMVGESSLFQLVDIARVLNQDDPLKYKDFAEWATVIAGKYGNSNISGSVASFYTDRVLGESNLDYFGRNNINYLEIGNEQDKFWRGDLSLLGTGLNMYQMIPSQFAAYLSATFDGSCRFSDDNGPDFNIGGNNYIGVKNVAPEMKVVLGGLAGFQGKTLEETIDYCINGLGRNNSSDCSGSYLPFDVINFHHYCTTTNAIPSNSTADGFYGLSNVLPPNSIGIPLEHRFEYFYEKPIDIGLNGGKGVSPEEGGLRPYIELTLERLMNYVKENHPNVFNEFKNKEVWLSEFGYDTELGSPVSVKQISGQSLQQTQANWLVRSFLEIAAAEAAYKDDNNNEHKMKVHRAMVFDYRDTYNSSPLYQRSGLLKADYSPKKSWFHVQTMRNVLGETTYQGEFTGHEMDVVNGTFDFSGEARIYHFKGDYKGTERDILAIWSPNSSDSKGTLTLDFNQLQITDALGNPIDVSKFTIITPRDGDDDGYHRAITGITTNAYTFDGEHAITETPMYVVLGVAEQEADYHVCELAKPQVSSASCSSLTIRWAGSYGPSPQGGDKPSQVDIYITEGLGSFDVADPNIEFIVRDFDFARNQYNIGKLKEETEYTVHLIYKWDDGTIEICDVIGTTTNQLCRLQDGQDFKVIMENAQGYPFVYGNVGCSNWSVSPDDLSDGQMWTSNNGTTSATVEFAYPVDLRSISFLHTHGTGKMKIEFKNCDCPNEDWVLFKEMDISGYFNWYHVGDKPTGRNISNLRFTINYETSSNIRIALLSFCGEGRGCWYAIPGPTDPSEDNFVFLTVPNKKGRTISSGLSFEPVRIDDADPDLGHVKEYAIFYMEDNGQEMDFRRAKYLPGYLYDGLNTVDLRLDGLMEDTKYKAYLMARQIPGGWPCTSPLFATRPIILPSDFRQPEIAVADTIIYFDTFGEGIGVTAGSDQPKSLIKVDPNPTTGWTKIHWDLKGYDKLFIVSAYTGEVVVHYDVDRESVDTELDLTLFGNGPYYIRLEGDGLEPLKGQLIKTKE